MADWRRVQGRIRKARGSADPAGQLAALYESTGDAMVAFELAKTHEKTGDAVEAVRWYRVAAERFRRPQWKAKADDALARLGAGGDTSVQALPSAEPEGWTPFHPPARRADDHEFEPRGSVQAEIAFEDEGEAAPSPDSPAKSDTGTGETGTTAREAATLAEESGQQGRPGKRRRRRGRRGGRRRRKGKQAGATVAVAPTEEARPPSETSKPLPARERRREAPETVEPGTPAEHGAGIGPAAWLGRRRAAEPALASRVARLDSQLRRLITNPVYDLEEADEAPAGPGVFLLSDSDLITYYYVEACQTLRVGISNVARSGKGARGSGALRARFADHLGISESRVSRYMKEHCVVRWLQLDEGAPHMAHYAIAVLRPALND